MTAYYVTEIGNTVEWPPEGEASFKKLLKDFEIHSMHARAEDRNIQNAQLETKILLAR